ncbi:MAG: leucine-rich repeat domain-containing protein, partial [Christensenellales bacterium]
MHVDIQTNQVGRVRATLEDYLSYWSVDVLDLERIVVSDGPVNKTDMDYLASIAADPRSNLVRLDLSGTSFFETAGENDLLGNDVLEGCSLEYLALPSTGAFYAIGERALKDCPNLRRVEAAGAVSVGDEAFMGCEQLQDAVIPNARRIGDRAFFSCVGLETVDMALVEHIGEEAFLDCAVKALHMPWAEEIGDGAFLNCPVEYADMMRLTTLGDRAFYGNTHLLEIHLPNVQVVGKSAFEGCASVSMYTLEMGKVRAVRDNAFKGVTKLTALLMPKVQSVGAEAFRASEIRSVHMPEVKAVSDRAFYGCDQLEEIEIADAESIGASAFEECAALASLNAKSVQSIGPSAFSGCVSLAQANVKSVRTIGAQAFRGCALSGISLPNVTDIGQGAFENCLLLDDVIWPDTQVVLGLSAFSGCAFDFTAGYGCLGNPAYAVTDDNVADYAARQAPKMMLRLDPPDGGRNIVQESAFQMPAA